MLQFINLCNKYNKLFGELRIFKRKHRFFSHFFMPIFFYNLPFRICLHNIKKNWNGSVRQYPIYMRIASISYATDLIALAIPKFSYSHFILCMFIIWRTFCVDNMFIFISKHQKWISIIDIFDEIRVKRM